MLRGTPSPIFHIRSNPERNKGKTLLSTLKNIYGPIMRRQIGASSPRLLALSSCFSLMQLSFRQKVGPTPARNQNNNQGVGGTSRRRLLLSALHVKTKFIIALHPRLRKSLRQLLHRFYRTVQPYYRFFIIQELQSVMNFY